MPTRLAPELALTVEEFLAFTESRPDEERWELIEGEPVKNPAPTNWHQVIVGNVVVALALVSRKNRARWLALPGIGTLVPASALSLPLPDVQVLEQGVGAVSTNTTGDALVLFEVLSRSNTKADQAWRRKVYASIPNCQHYVTISQSKVEVVRYDRAARWQGAMLATLDESLELPALGRGVKIKLAEIYRSTPIGTAP